MEEGAYAAQLFAAILFLIAGGRLIRLSLRTHEAPERLLGLYFSLTGISYVGWVLPVIAPLESWAGASDFTAWIVYSVGVVPYLIFSRIVFRPHALWANAIVIGCVSALALSAATLAWLGRARRARSKVAKASSGRPRWSSAIARSVSPSGK